MGNCASSQSQSPSQSRSRSRTNTKTVTATGKSGALRAAESFRRPSSIVVMDLEGGAKEYKNPIPASHVTSQNPDCYLCNSESVYIGTCMPRVPDEEELQPGRIYFVIPLSQSDHPLSLPLLCDLAIKASSAITC